MTSLHFRNDFLLSFLKPPGFDLFHGIQGVCIFDALDITDDIRTHTL